MQMFGVDLLLQLLQLCLHLCGLTLLACELLTEAERVSTELLTGLAGVCALLLQLFYLGLASGGLLELAVLRQVLLFHFEPADLQLHLSQFAFKVAALLPHRVQLLLLQTTRALLVVHSRLQSKPLLLQLVLSLQRPHLRGHPLVDLRL